MKTPTQLLACVLILGTLTTSSLLAQKSGSEDGPVGIFNSQQEYNEFMGSAKRVAYGPNGSAELQAMIPMINDIVTNQSIGSTAGKYNAESSTLGMLSNETIRDELEMVDSQYKELQQLNSEIQDRVADQIRGLDFSDPQGIADQIRKIRSEAKSDLESVLLPHQLDRLRQLQMQSSMRHRTLVEILTSDPVKTELEITEDQSKELREEEREIEKELEKEIAELRRKARQRLLSKLKRQQRQQVEELLGSPFEFPTQQEQPNKRKRRGAAGRK